MYDRIESFLRKAQRKGDFNIIDLLEKAHQEFGTISQEEAYAIASVDKYSGQSYTPASIAQLMAALGGLNNPKNVLDPCCGIGHILSYCNYSEDLTGIDFNQNIIETAKLLNNRPIYFVKNYLTADLTKKYDLIVADMPFGGRVDVNGRRAPIEKLFLQKIFVDLKEKGTAIVLVPNNVLSALIFQEFREKVINQYSLDAVFDLPPGSLPRAHISTSILLIRKSKPTISKVFLSQFDGNTSHTIKQFTNQTGDHWIERSIIADTWDHHFYDPKFMVVDDSLKGQEVKTLSEIAEVFRGLMIQSDNLKQKDKYLVLSGKNIQDGKLIHTEKDRYVDELPDKHFRRSVLREGDIFISLIFNDRKLYTYKKNDPPAVINHNCAIIRSVNNPFIRLYLQTKDGRKLFEMQAEQRSTGSVIRHISLANLSSIKIPIIPLADLNQLSFDSILSNTKQENKELAEQLSTIEAINTNPQLINLLQEIKSIVIRVENKVDQILSSLQDLQSRFSTIRLENRDGEEKLLLLYSALDRKLSEISQNLKEEIDVYESLAERVIVNWDKLDSLSMQFLPLAEYLFSKLRELPEADYSPAILQFCKALENEVLKKLFVSFTLYMTTSEQSLNVFLKTDLSMDENGKERKTTRFARMIKKYAGKPSDEMKYTLGDMSFILQLVAGEKTLRESPLLQSFKTYIGIHFNQEQFLSVKYLNGLQFIIDSFRNKCAHPYKLDEAVAIECRNLVPRDIDKFLDYYLK